MGRSTIMRSSVFLFALALLGVGALLTTTDLGWAQGSGGITGIWKQCNGAGYLVLLGGGEQVNVVGSQVEVGRYSFDGSRVHVTTGLYYPGSGAVRAVSAASESVVWYDYDPGTSTLVGEGGSPGQCYSKLPVQ